MEKNQAHILFVEDHQDTSEIVKLTLEMAGYKVTGANTVADALPLIKSNQFDLYLFDGKLPDGTGIELCQQVREFDPYRPVIFYSASAYAVNKDQALSAGAQEYLIKPCDPEVLEQAIEQLLKKGHNGQRVQ
jgi:DNA-binding response OmpR family regulator